MTQAIVPQAIENRGREVFDSERMVVLAQTSFQGETLTVRGVPEAQAIVRVDLGRASTIRSLPACAYVRRPRGGGAPMALVSLGDAERALESAQGARGRAIRDVLRDTARDWRRQQAQAQVAAEIGPGAEAYIEALAQVDDLITEIDAMDAASHEAIRAALKEIEERGSRREALMAARGRISHGHMEAVAKEDARLGVQHRALVEGSERMAIALGQKRAIERHAEEIGGTRWTMTQLARRICTTEAKCWEALAAQGLAERRTIHSSRTGQIVGHGIWVPTERGVAAGISRTGTRTTIAGGFGGIYEKLIEVPAPGILTSKGAATLMDALHMAGCTKTEAQHHAVLYREHTENYLAQRQAVLDDMQMTMLEDSATAVDSPADKIVAEALAASEETSHALFQ